jgi:hypothetical protein
MSETPVGLTGQREIKFRAWDTIAKKMVEVEKIVFHLGRLHIVNDHVAKRFVLMEWTGLKDKNGQGDLRGGRHQLLG